MATERKETQTADTQPGEPDQKVRRECRFTVLIADDDKGIRETLGEVLENQGFRTVLASDGGQAVEIVQVELIHITLFDMNMPRLTGLEALSVIRQTLDRLLPAILMTADATNDLIRKAFQAQVFSVIPKPVNTNIVLNTLARALAHAHHAHKGVPGSEQSPLPHVPPSARPPGAA